MFFTLSSRRVGADVVNRVRLTFALVLIAGWHWVVTGEFFPFETEPWRWGILAISSIAGLAIGDGALFLSFLYIGPRLAMLLMTTVPVMSAFFAWILFGETIGLRESIGIAITLAGVGWVILERPGNVHSGQYPRERFVAGILLALVGALGQTANLVVTKFALVDGYSALSATEVRILVSMLLLWGWAGARGQWASSLAKLHDRTAMLLILGGAIAGPFLGIWFSYIAIQHTRVGIASTIMATPPLLLIPLSAIFLGEKTSVRGWMGTIVALAGVALLVARN